jgi:hypothetical protein
MCRRVRTLPKEHTPSSRDTALDRIDIALYGIIYKYARASTGGPTEQRLRSGVLTADHRHGGNAAGTGSGNSTDRVPDAPSRRSVPVFWQNRDCGWESGWLLDFTTHSTCRFANPADAHRTTPLRVWTAVPNEIVAHPWHGTAGSVSVQSPWKIRWAHRSSAGPTLDLCGKPHTAISNPFLGRVAFRLDTRRWTWVAAGEGVIGSFVFELTVPRPRKERCEKSRSRSQTDLMG